MMTMLKSETASESLPDNHSEIPEIVKQEICDYCGVDCVLRKIPGFYKTEAMESKLDS